MKSGVKKQFQNNFFLESRFWESGFNQRYRFLIYNLVLFNCE